MQAREPHRGARATESLGATERALTRIGLEVTSENASTGVIVAVRPLTSADISGAVREAELPRVQRIMSEELGPAGANGSDQPR